jgi:hypothetical protein
MPIDPVGGGTWVAANDAGLVLALLNYNPDRRDAVAATSMAAESRCDRQDPQPGSRATNSRHLASRGTIIPSLLHCESASQSISRTRTLDVTAYPCFRLVILDSSRCIQMLSDGRALHMTEEDAAHPLLFTSSGLGDQLVEGPRRELFRHMLPGLAGHDLPAAQDAFHRHHWPTRTHLSVWMSRPDARTVSRTTVEVQPRDVRMTYQPIAADPSPQRTSVQLLRCRIEHGVAVR